MVKNTKMVGISNKIKKEIDIIFMKKKDDANNMILKILQKQ